MRAAPALLSSWVIEQRGPAQPRPEVTHDTLEVSITARGAQHGRCAGRPVTARAGEYLLIEPAVPHAAQGPADPYLAWTFHLRPAALRLLADDAGLPARWTTGVFSAGRSLPDAARLLVRELGMPGAASSLVVESLAVVMATQLLRIQRGPRTRAAQPTAHRIARAEERLRAGLAESISLADLAEEAGLSVYHFVRQFRRRYGAPPHAYQLALRVDAAHDRLVATGDSITAIALDVGFSSPSRLTEAYRRRRGITPSAARRLHAPAGES